MTKITLEDTMLDVFEKMSENHINATTILAELIKKGKIIDPYCDPLMKLLFMDTLGIYGERIWKLYQNCNWDILKFCAVIRGCQLGHVCEEKLNGFIDNKETLNIDEISFKVKRDLPEFGVAYEAERVELSSDDVDCNVETKDGRITITSSSLTGEQIAKRYFFLAYEASNVGGFGLLQARNEIKEEEVWNNVTRSGDYPGNFNRSNCVSPYADYVFGRMMKVGCTVLENGIVVYEGKGQLDYQSWASRYPTFKDLAIAAIKSLYSDSLETETVKNSDETETETKVETLKNSDETETEFDHEN
jgi:hypothetical protein